MTAGTLTKTGSISSNDFSGVTVTAETVNWGDGATAYNVEDKTQKFFIVLGNGANVQ